MNITTIVNVGMCPSVKTKSSVMRNAFVCSVSQSIPRENR